MALPVPVENNGVTTRGGVTGRGFLPGHSANPGGRPKGLAALIREHTGEGAELVEFMLLVFRGKRKASLKLRMEAVQWLTDRGWGKALQQMEVSGPEAQPLTIRVEYGEDALDERAADYPTS